jgi:hypothetical protein
MNKSILLCVLLSVCIGEPTYVYASQAEVTRFPHSSKKNKKQLSREQKKAAKKLSSREREIRRATVGMVATRCILYAGILVIGVVGLIKGLFF